MKQQQILWKLNRKLLHFMIYNQSPTLTPNKIYPQENHTAFTCSPHLRRDNSNHQSYLQKPQPLLHPPSRIVKSYHIDYTRTIGSGNFSVVYPAFDSHLPSSSQLVVKLINMQKMRDAQLVHLVQNQTDIIQILHHDHVISSRDVVVTDYWGYIFMDYCDGGSLEDYIKLHHCLVPENQNSLRLVNEILEGLIYLQHKNIIHRDIKAANIFLKENRAIIADFGFARFLNGMHIVQDLNLGSLPFMAPEAIKNSIYNEKTDVWSFGVLVYEIFHGQSLYAKSHNIQELKEKVSTPITASSNIFRPDLSLAVRQLIVNCLTIDYQQRPFFSQIKQSWFYKQLFERKKMQNVNSARNKFTSPNYDFVVEVGHKEQTSLRSELKHPNAYNLASTPRRIVIQGNQRHLSPQNSRIQRLQFSGQRTPINQSHQNSRKQSSSASPFPKISFGKAVRKPIHIGQSSNDEHRNKNQPLLIQSPTKNIRREDRDQIIQNKPRSEMTERITMDKKSSTSSTAVGKYTFKEILLAIQESRDYYKLGINLKTQLIHVQSNSEAQTLDGNNKKIKEIRNRMILRAYRKICEVEQLIQNDQVLYGVEPIDVRKSKVLSVVGDYKKQFDKQIKKRDLTSMIQKDHTNKNIKTPSFIKIISAKHLSFDEEDTIIDSEDLIEKDLRILEKMEINTRKNKKDDSDSIYLKKIKTLIDDLRELKKSFKPHREV